jgi:hypothetical protein
VTNLAVLERPAPDVAGPAPVVHGGLRGSTIPRLMTVPLAGPEDPWVVWWAPRCGCGCWLTPWSSYGFDVLEFAQRRGWVLDPWQRLAVIHAGELLPDGRPRFRTVLILVARQNGKTFLLKILVLFWLFAQRQPMVVWTSTNLDYARAAWQHAIAMAGDAGLSGNIDDVREANGQEEMTTVDGCTYKIATKSRRGGRSLTINRLVGDELREHHDWAGYNAAVNAMNAVSDGQAWFITNQGDERGVVLDSLRADALAELAAGAADTDTVLMEWSAPDNTAVDDPAGLAAANPNLGRAGHGVSVAALLKAAARAKRQGGELESGFRTEVLCQRVRLLDPAIDPSAWTACLDPGDLADARRRVALCVDVAQDCEHATLMAAAQLPDGRVRLEVVAAWTGRRALDDMRGELDGWLLRIRPAVLGWLPNGPAAAAATDLRGQSKWPRSMAVEEIRGEVSAVCMGFAEQVAAQRIAHSGDPLLDAHVAGAERAARGDAWVFVRRGVGHVDACYAGAGAVHLARMLPPPHGRLRVITADEPE